MQITFFQVMNQDRLALRRVVASLGLILSLVVTACIVKLHDVLFARAHSDAEALAEDARTLRSLHTWSDAARASTSTGAVPVSTAGAVESWFDQHAAAVLLVYAVTPMVSSGVLQTLHSMRRTTCLICGVFVACATCMHIPAPYPAVHTTSPSLISGVGRVNTPFNVLIALVYASVCGIREMYAPKRMTVLLLNCIIAAVVYLRVAMGRNHSIEMVLTLAVAAAIVSREYPSVGSADADIFARLNEAASARVSAMVHDNAYLTPASVDLLASVASGSGSHYTTSDNVYGSPAQAAEYCHIDDWVSNFGVFDSADMP
jgi:hypothetical protein